MDRRGWNAAEVAAGTLPRLRLVGQLDDTLLICDSELGTLLIDQHRAHERVIYDRLLAGESRTVAPPLFVALSALDVARLHDQHDELSNAGWHIDLQNDGAQISGVPPELEPHDLFDILARARHEDAGTLLAEAACHAAIRKRRTLSPDAAATLLEALTTCANPVTCPHGQPIVVRLDRAFLERQFEWH